MEISKNLQITLKNLPKKPGVYIFYDKFENLLYVGKAKNLKKRVSSYFQESKNHSTRIWLMITLIARIEYSVVKTEEESLILEANLIHQWQPKYNVMLKDDKSFVYLRLSLEEEIPRILFTRKKYSPKSLYFGPYTKKVDLVNILRTIRRIFPYCSKGTRDGKPCEYVAIKQCDGVCIDLETKDQYMHKIEQIVKILEGKTEQVKDFLKEKIQFSVNSQNFELAALYRDRLKVLDTTVSNQRIVLNTPVDLDIVSLVIKEADLSGLQVASIHLQQIREGRVVNVQNFILSGSGDSQDTLLEDKTELGYNYLQQFFSSYYLINPKKIQVYTQIFIEKEEKK